MTSSYAATGETPVLTTPNTRSAAEPLAYGLAIVADAVVREAAALIDSSGIASMLDEWAAPMPVGRSAVLSSRAILIGWVVLALEGASLTTKNVTQLLGQRLTPSAAVLVGVNDLADASPKQLYGRVRRGTERMLAPVDSTPLPTRQRRLTKAEWDAVQRQRSDHADELEQKRRRFVQVANALLGAQYDSLPDATRTRRVSTAVDSRFRPAGTAGIPRSRLAALPDIARVSAEPDAGFHVTHASSADTDPGAARARYGWEDELVVLTSSDPAHLHAVPTIAIGFNTHTPGKRPAQAVREVFDHIVGRGITLGHVIADRVYLPAASPEVLQSPLRRHGARLVMDYRIRDWGVQAETPSAVLVDGNWYSPQMPAHLRTATADYHAALEAAAEGRSVTHQRRTTFRAEARARRDAALDERRRYAVGCPSDEELPAQAAKYEQHYPYGSPEWEAAWRHGRNAVEAYATRLRASEADALSPGGRLRGATGQAFLAVLGVVATNSRSISAWMNAQAAQ